MADLPTLTFESSLDDARKVYIGAGDYEEANSRAKALQFAMALRILSTVPDESESSIERLKFQENLKRYGVEASAVKAWLRANPEPGQPSRSGGWCSTFDLSRGRG